MRELTEVEKNLLDDFINGLQKSIDSLCPLSIHMAMSKIPEESYPIVFERLAEDNSLIVDAVNKYISLKVDHSGDPDTRSYDLQLAKDQLRVLCAYGAGVSTDGHKFMLETTMKISDDEGICQEDKLAIGNSGIFDLIDPPYFEAVMETVESFSSLELLSKYYKIIRKNPYLTAVIRHKQMKVDIDSRLKYFKRSSSDRPTKQFKSLLANPKKKLVKNNKGWDMKRTSLYPYLSECNCSMFSRKTRCKIEKQILEYAVENLSKTDEITYLSLGAGELLQDYIIIGKLLLAGFKKLNIVLVDPRIDRDSLRQFSSLSSLAAEQQADQFRFQTFSSITEFREANPDAKIQLAVAIDFADVFKVDGVFSDVIQLHSLLADNGRYFFSFAKFKLIMSQNSLLSLHVDYPTDLKNNFALIRDKLHHDVSLDDKVEVNYLSLGLTFNFFECINIIPALKRDNLTAVIITMFQPRQVDYNECIKDKPNSGFNEDNMRYFLSLCLPDVDINVRFVDPHEKVEDLLNSNNEYDVISILDANNADVVAEVQSKCPNSSLYAHFLSVSDTNRDVRAEIVCHNSACNSSAAIDCS